MPRGLHHPLVRQADREQSLNQQFAPRRRELFKGTTHPSCQLGLVGCGVRRGMVVDDAVVIVVEPCEHALLGLREQQFGMRFGGRP